MMKLCLPLLILCFSALTFAQAVLKDSRVLYQGTLGACASASLSTILEAELPSAPSFVDIAINDAWAKSPLFNLEGSNHSSLLYSIRRIGVCPRSESFYETQGNLDDSLGRIHAKLTDLMYKAQKFSPEEKAINRDHQTEVLRQIKAFRSAETPRELLKTSLFLKQLYTAARAQKGETRNIALEWVDAYAEYQYLINLEANYNVAQILKELSENLYTGDAWEQWLKSNVIKAPAAKTAIAEDVKAANKTKIQAEITEFAQALYDRLNGSPNEFEGVLAGIKKPVVDWVFQTIEMMEEFKLIPSQKMALINILTSVNPGPDSPSYSEFREKTLEHLRTFFRVSCAPDSSKRMPVTMEVSGSLKVQEFHVNNGRNWEQTLSRVSDDIRRELEAGHPIGLSYASDVVLKQKIVPVVNESKGLKGFLHASVITAMKTVNGEVEYLIHNSWGTKCEEYYDNTQCVQGKIWVKASRLVPYTETLTYFNH